jgi:hypothetical protein
MEPWYPSATCADFEILTRDDRGLTRFQNELCPVKGMNYFGKINAREFMNPKR